jgi:hypothetical protein
MDNLYSYRADRKEDILVIGLLGNRFKGLSFMKETK